MMTKQEIFDKVATHLLTQKKRSYASNSCAYRGDYGGMCAVGVLISDEFYDEKMEGSPVKDLINDFPKACKDFSDEGSLLQALQDIHDVWPAYEWSMRLRKCADIFDLSSAVLEKF